MSRISSLSFGALALLAGVACTSQNDSSASGNSDATIQVSSTDDACELSATSAPSGNVVFEVTNDGGQVTEFYVYAEDGVRVVGEVENIGPGISRNLVVQVAPGEYLTACKPGMSGDGIRAAFTVTDSGVDPLAAADIVELAATASDRYHDYVHQQATELLEATEDFAALVVGGDDEAARALYPQARTYWERIEPVAEAFGDLDPRLDLREADLEPGQEWTGWHVFEKDLWPPTEGYSALTAEQRSALADLLVADTAELLERVDGSTYDPTVLGNGAKELLDEVATGKVTGEEEIWSHTDLWDFQANIDGARVAFEVLQPMLDRKDPELVETLTDRFAAVQASLDTHRDGAGFVFYDELTEAEVRQLVDAVDALAEPLSNLTAAVVL
ncbi:MAG: iron uptake system protein EfeO [Ilumatobacteraceae bacterium]